MSHVELEDNLISVGESDDIDNDKVRLYGATSVGTRLVVPTRRPMTSPDTTSSITSLQVSSSSQQVSTVLTVLVSVMKSSRPWPWLASRTLYEVLGLGRQVLGLGLGLGLGPQVLDNWLPHNNFTFCNYSMK